MRYDDVGDVRAPRLSTLFVFRQGLVEDMALPLYGYSQ
jgi:hypothetical protein